MQQCKKCGYINYASYPCYCSLCGEIIEQLNTTNGSKENYTINKFRVYSQTAYFNKNCRDR